jgi:hypothetical protein
MHVSSEYDAFGPWIDEVHTIADLPWLYRDAGIDPAACHLVLKVPRDIARRDATPDMHLYDHLLAVGEEALTVLSRFGGTYNTAHIPFDEIAAIEDSTVLLDGRLTVHTVRGGSVSISYNGSASPAIQDLVFLLRRLYLPPPPESEPVPDDLAAGRQWPDLGVKDIGLVSAYRILARQEPRTRLVGATTRRVVSPRSGGFERLASVVWPTTLHASLTVTDDREIQMIHRRRWLTHGGGSIDSLARTVLPLIKITAVRTQPHERYKRVHLVTVHAGAACLRFPMPAEPRAKAILAQFTTSPAI